MRMHWHVRVATVTGDHITQTWRGGDAERKARRAFAPLAPVEGSGMSYVSLMHGPSIHNAAELERKG